MTPEEIRNQSKLDQATATLADHLPRLWRRMYDNLREHQFSDAESMELLKTYINASCRQASE